jgi:hypothetical protein
MMRAQQCLTAVMLGLAAPFLLADHLPLGKGQPHVQPPQSVADTKLQPARIPYIDTHVHFDPKVVSDPSGQIDTALHAASNENAATLIFMPGPYISTDPASFDYEIFVTALKKHLGRLAFEAGGGSLNPMLQASIRAEDSGPGIQQIFKERAEQILSAGAIGFGEMSSEHLSLTSGQVYETAPPDHPLLLLLADIAAQHNVPIDLHLDVVPQTIPLPFGVASPPNPAKLQENLAAFERLLAHNPRAKILWAHAGQDGIGYRTPDLCRRLLQAHPNLYMEIKIDPLLLGKNPPLDASSKIQPEWLALFKDFPDRFVIGSDQHYGSARFTTGPQRWQSVILLLNQLPADLQRKIASENARRIFHLPQDN